MTYYADLSRLPDPRLTLIAVGWLDSAHPYEQGPVEEAFFLRLMKALVEPWQPFATAGFHRCEFCRFSGGPGSISYSTPRTDSLTVTVGAANLFVPGRDVLYMAPSLIAHYIDGHEYSPPREFVDAVMACPEMKSAQYLRAIHAVGGAKLLKPPTRGPGADRLHAVVHLHQRCPQCGADADVSHVQSVVQSRLRYSEGLRCSECKCAIEADGDALPDDVRGAFYETHGRWELCVVDIGASVVFAARALAQALQVPTPDALKLLKQVDAKLLEGTRVEVGWLEQQLDAFGVRTRARECE